MFSPSAASTTVGGLLAWATNQLHRHGVPAARWDAEVLLGAVIGAPPLRLALMIADPVSAEAAAQYRELVRRRAAREPLQYILGRQEFMGLDFAVDDRVLVPRPETEHLVEAALAYLNEAALGRTASAAEDAMLAADLGTGSGAIAVALAVGVPGLRVWAIDISADAIAVATANAARHGVADRIVFAVGDLFAPLPEKLIGRLTLVASNPPYIASRELPELQAEVRREPRLALDGGPDGLAFYRRIVAEAPRWLRAGGLLALEIGAGQGAAVAGMVADSGAYADWTVQRDYAGHDRVVLAKTRGETGCCSR